MINQSFVYAGVIRRRGQHGKSFKIGQSSQAFPIRENQIKHKYNDSFEMLIMKECPDDSLECRLNIESNIRTILAKKYRNIGNDWFVGTITEKEFLEDFNKAYNAAIKMYNYCKSVL